MKSTIVLFVCLFTSSAIAQDTQIPKHEGSEELQQIKGLVGIWVGEMDHGQGPQKVQIVYRVTAAGSAVMETFNPGTPMEMVTMYHDQKGKLAMTHYCMLGNQPRMRLVRASDKKLALDLVKNSDIKEDEPHMNALTIDFLDANRIRHTWGCCQGGDKITNMSVEFKRKK
ncbi:MAG: hypothetical protein H8E66_33720 [Planctomycetes bacterium]|nr:hypothetical protein [Planctomycetota bacterium]